MTDSFPRNLSFLAFPLSQFYVHQKGDWTSHALTVHICHRLFTVIWIWSDTFLFFLRHLPWSSFLFLRIILACDFSPGARHALRLGAWSRFTRRGIHFCKVFSCFFLGPVLQQASRHQTVEKGARLCDTSSWVHRVRKKWWYRQWKTRWQFTLSCFHMSSLSSLYWVFAALRLSETESLQCLQYILSMLIADPPWRVSRQDHRRQRYPRSLQRWRERVVRRENKSLGCGNSLCCRKIKLTLLELHLN